MKMDTEQTRERAIDAGGRRHVVIPPQNAGPLASRYPDCRIEIFAGGGHAFQAQEPDRLAALMRGFLRG